MRPEGGGGLEAVEEEDVFVLCGDGNGGLAGFVGFDEDGGHFQKRTVVQRVPVGGGDGLGGVGRAEVAAFAPVVPGDEFDVVGLELQQVLPARDEDGGVLGLRPVVAHVEALEEPGGYGRHPFFPRGGAFGGEEDVQGGFFGGGKVGVDPGEDAGAGGLGEEG